MPLGANVRADDPGARMRLAGHVITPDERPAFLEAVRAALADK